MSTREAAALLERIPGLYARLGDVLAPGAIGNGQADQERVTGGGGDEKPAPANLAVVDHRQQLRDGLRWWLDRVDAPLRVLPHTVGTRPAVATEAAPAPACAWLLHTLELWPRGWAGELADNLGAWASRARRLQLPPTVRSRLPLGSCPTEADPELWQCNGTVWAAIPTNPEDPVRLECDGCGRRPDMTELDGALTVWLPVHVVADLLGVSVRTVQRRTPERDDGLVRLGDALEQPQLESVAHKYASVAH